MERDLTWTCHVCGDERPDAMISVASAEGDLGGAKMQVNQRYCNDREECKEQAEVRAEVLAAHYSHGGEIKTTNITDRGNEMTITVAEVAKGRIRPDPNQPRKKFEDIAELAESLNVHGLLQPITVRPVEGDPDVDYEIVAGERRWRASLQSTLETIPCIIRDVDDDAVFELQVLENVARKQMNPIEEAAAYQQLMDGGLKPAEIEKRLGLCTGMVVWQVKVLQCHDSVQHLVARGQYSLTQATQLGRLSKDGQLIALREQQAKNLSGNAFTELVNTIWARENQREMFPETKLDAATLDAADKFRSALTRLAKDSRTITAVDPDLLARAFAHELPFLDAEITAAMQALQRVKRGVQREGGRQAAQGLLV